MEDTIEICSGCGKMPRPIDYLNDQFLCSRCGCSGTTLVSSEEYEHTVTKLDAKFHKGIIESRVAVIRKEHGPIRAKAKKPVRKAKKSTRKPAKKPSRKAAKKAPKKKTSRKAAKKPTKRKPAKKPARKKTVKKKASRKKKK